MDVVTPITKTEGELYFGYEDQRRLQLLRFITPTFIIVCAMVFLIIAAALLTPLPPLAQRALFLSEILLLSVIVLLALGLLAIRAGKLTLAAGLVAAATVLGTASSVAIWSSFLGLDPFALIEFTPFSVAIILAGVLGDLWTVIIATIATNLLTILLFWLTPRAPGLEQIINAELPLLLPISLIYQWLFASLMIAISRTFKRTLGQVGVAYERARQLDALKDEFIASVNHELRTPLMTMQTYMETLRETSDTIAPEQLRSALNQACQVGDSLVDLVKSILSSRQIDRDVEAIEAEVIALRAAIFDAARLIDPREAGSAVRDLRVDVDDDLVVWGDRIRLQQILTNLLTNAAKYSDAGTPIEVSARRLGGDGSEGGRWRARRQQGAHQRAVEIAVRDHGLGIPPEQIPLLFNRFMRLPRDLASKTPGTGLGLYLCRVMTVAMGGRIWVESAGTPGDGSTFYVELPLPPPSADVILSRRQASLVS
jgi:two-component system phosphate regulon sensor histidine kinase PhoR